MKNIFRIGFVFMMMTAFFFAGCSSDDSSDGSGNNNGGNTNASTDVSGWYKYTTTANNVSSTYYLEYDSDGNVLRAGSDAQEFTGTVLETYKSTMSYSSLKDNSSNAVTFTKISESDLPSWYSSGSDGGVEEDDESVYLTIPEKYETYSKTNVTVPYSSISGLDSTDTFTITYTGNTNGTKFLTTATASVNGVSFYATSACTVTYYVTDTTKNVTSNTGQVIFNIN